MEESMSNVIDALEERGFIEALTSQEIRQHITNPVKVYCGFDPTAESLHLGNLVGIIGLAWFQKYGHTPVVIVGGATGMIGDPSGKSNERQLLDEKTIRTNLLGIKKNLEAILDFEHYGSKPLIINNFDWYKELSVISFLRDVGSLFRIGPMLGRESVRLRLQSEEGMSFTEFSYQILQGYDYLHLFQNFGVTIQIGGSDQWGNITSGTELIRRVHSRAAYGLTFPLLTRSDGQKFGKSEKGAIWLSPEKLSPYEFYQYLVRTEDADVTKLMRMLTFMDMQEIKWFEKQMREPDYVPRTAQKRLASELTQLVHGEPGLKTAIRVTEGIAPGSQTKLNATLLEDLATDMPCCQMRLEQVVHVKLIDLLVEIGMQSSKGDARRLIRNGGVYINNEKIEDENYIVNDDLLIDHRLMLLSTGKKNKMLIRIRER